MSPYKRIHEKEQELGRQLTAKEHIEIIEVRLHEMRIRFYVIVALLIISIVGGGTAALYVYGKAQEEAIKVTCVQANARWSRLRSNLIRIALQRRNGETDAEYNSRSAQTLGLLDGLFAINCDDPTQRVPPEIPSRAEILSNGG